MRIAILYICTGSYVELWRDFFDSAERHFLLDCEKHYFVFTDSDKIYNGDNSRVHTMYQEPLPWPFPTLYRFRFFKKIEKELLKYDYVYFFNADCMFLKDISAEEIGIGKKGIVVVQHPGFYNVLEDRFPYERNRQSSAFIPFGLGRVYVAGGLNGGSTNEYLHMVHTLDERITEDERKGVIAVWHDESQINRYLVDFCNYTLLSPAYLYPEGWEIPFEPKILLRDKRKFFDLPDNKKAETFEATKLGYKNIFEYFFRELKEERATIFGTGINAKRIIDVGDEFNIVSITVDYEFDQNELYGKKVLQLLDAITSSTYMIVAANDRSTEQIMNRIKDKIPFGYAVFGMYGERLN